MLCSLPEWGKSVYNSVFILSVRDESGGFFYSQKKVNRKKHRAVNSLGLHFGYKRFFRPQGGRELREICGLVSGIPFLECLTLMYVNDEKV